MPPTSPQQMWPKRVRMCGRLWMRHRCSRCGSSPPAAEAGVTADYSANDASRSIDPCSLSAVVACADQPLLVVELCPVVGVGDQGSVVAQRFQLPAPQMSGRLLPDLGRPPRDTPTFLELDDAVLAVAALLDRHGEDVADGAHPLP